jgi:type IV secretory pathway VirJ component
MKSPRRLAPFAIPLALALAIAIDVAPARAAVTESSFDVGRFGTVTLYQPSPHPAHVALFVSGDGGWNKGVVDMAHTMASQDTLVVGINIRHYLKALAEEKSVCAYAAEDFESLSQIVQQKVGMPRYELPVLVGYSSGATLVYAVLAEAPANTFRGAVALGFCPDLDLEKELCKGAGLEWDPPKGKPGKDHKTYIFRPAPKLDGKFVALQGMNDKICDPPSTESYVHQIPNGDVKMLPEVGHGFSKPAHWQSAFDDALSEVYATRVVATATAPKPTTPAGVEDLPLVELRPAHDRRQEMAVLLSGDGGWAGIDRDVGGALAAAGMPVVGWNSLQYYWKARTPEVAAADLARILRHYFDVWHEERAVLIGYSFGADVLPFLVTRLPADLRSRVALVTLLGPSREATFEFHVSEWLHANAGKGSPTLPEVVKLRGTPMLCVYGEKEGESLCRDLPAGLARLLPTEGKHHFGGDYAKLASAVLAAAEEVPAIRGAA